MSGPPPRPDLDRLRTPIPWRPAPQVGDAGYAISKPHLRALLRRAQRPVRR